MVYTKKCHKVPIFNTCSNLMHHGGYLENILWLKFLINDGLHLNLPLCYEIVAHMNNSILMWNRFLVCNNEHNIVIGKTKKINVNFSMKFDKYRKITIRNIFFHQSFQFVLKPWNLYQILLNFSLEHYAMMMLTIDILKF
jgi:hypothetical protein